MAAGVCDRRDAFLTDFHGRDLVSEAELALDAEGNLLALRATNTSNLGASAISFVPLAKGIAVSSSVYDIPASYTEPGPRGRALFVPLMWRPFSQTARQLPDQPARPPRVKSDQEQHRVGHLDRFPDPTAAGSSRSYRHWLRSTSVAYSRVHGVDPDRMGRIGPRRLWSRPAPRLSDDWAMNEINFAGPEIAASRQRGITVDEGELWKTLRLETERAAAGEKMLRGFLDLAVLRHNAFASGLGLLLARKLAEDSMPAERLGEIARVAMAGDPTIIAAAIADLIAVRTRDPAAESYLKPFLYYKGFHALQWHRIGHWLWRDGRRELAYFLQSRVSEVFAVDIHPAVPIGSGVFIDHGTGLVVGETAVIGDDVSILHEVTLGGTGKERGDRHPKVRDGVLLCAGAKVLGNVEIGRDAKVGAGSVVLHDVPPRATVAGVPARIVGWSSGSVPALEMDQSLPDYEI